MSNIKYTFVEHDGFKSITVLRNGELLVANNEHPYFEEIVRKARAGDESVYDLFEIGKAAAQRFERLGERVFYRNGVLYFDGEPVNSALSKEIVRFVEANVEDWRPLVCFFEKVATNPNEHSREQMFRWLDKHDFALAPDGDIIAYKGVYRNDKHGYISSNSGTATVNGEEITGRIPNPVGAIIEMPRSEVHHDPSTGCSTGLHAGNWRYARAFASVVLKVKINPRDVVSIPTDSNDEKMRVCRYVVLGEVDSPVQSAVDLSAAYEAATDEYDYVAPDFHEPVHVTDTAKVQKVDTRLNHTKQVRDANGRFVKKS